VLTHIFIDWKAFCHSMQLTTTGWVHRSVSVGGCFVRPVSAVATDAVQILTTSTSTSRYRLHTEGLQPTTCQ